MKKPEIKLNPKPISKAEIEKNMNFNKLISGHTPLPGNLSKMAKLYLSASVAVLTVAGVAYFAYQKQNGTTAKQEAFITPPVAYLATKPGQFVINTERDTTITFENGSSVFIPAGSFMDKDGKDVAGKVELSYREFHDQVDFIFSGIPMNYDSAGVQYQFESAGMFEVKASRNGEALALKPGKEITVNMISYNEENYFNAYYLDTVQRKWVYDGDNTRANKKQVAEQMEKKLLSPEMQVEADKLIEPKKADPNLYNFVIDFNKEEFPELAVYEGTKFEVDKGFDEKLTKVVWEDVFIKRHDGKKYLVTFKFGKKSSGVLATPVLDEANFDAAMQEYTKRRKAHLVSMRKKNDSLLVVNADYTRQAGKSDNNSRFANAVNNGTVYRSIVVGNLGIYNADRYVQFVLEARLDKERRGGLPSAEFIRDNGEQVALRAVYLVRRNMNSIYPLTYNQFGKFPLDLAHSADIMIGVAADYKLLYLMDQEIKNVTATDDKAIFKMHEMDNTKKDLVEIKQMLRI